MSLPTALCHDVLERIFDQLDGCDLTRLNQTGDGRMQEVVARCAKSVHFNMPHFARFPSLACLLPSIRALKVETLSTYGAYPLKHLPAALPASWSNLTHLRLNYRQSFDALSLLRPLSSLAHLSCKGSATPLAKGWEACLPPNLTTLKLFTSDFDPIFTSWEHLPQSLRCLRTNAFSLRFIDPNGQPIQWPPHLERLSLYLQRSESEDALNFLPPHLTQLYYAVNSGYQPCIIASKLPVHLRRLECIDSCLLIDRPVPLPPYLQVCVLRTIKLVDGVSVSTLPSSLERFDFNKNTPAASTLLTIYDNLPNLTEYELEDNDTSNTLRDLSHRKFKYLCITNGDPLIRSVWRFRLPNTIKALYTIFFRIDETIAKFELPHGLTQLNLANVSGITLEAWRSLPSTIVDLHFTTYRSSAQPCQLLAYLPPKLEVLNVVIFPLIEACDERDAFQHMPFTLKTLSLCVYISAESPLEHWIATISTRCLLEKLSVRIQSHRLIKKDVSVALSGLPATLRALTFSGTRSIRCETTLSTECFRHLPRQLTLLDLHVTRIAGDVSDFATLPPSIERFRLTKEIDFTPKRKVDIIDHMPSNVIDFDFHQEGGSHPPAVQKALDQYYARPPWQ